MTSVTTLVLAYRSTSRDVGTWSPNTEVAEPPRLRAAAVEDGSAPVSAGTATGAPPPSSSASLRSTAILIGFSLPLTTTHRRFPLKAQCCHLGRLGWNRTLVVRPHAPCGPKQTT